MIWCVEVHGIGLFVCMSYDMTIMIHSSQS
jgi:hypothetical protein